MMLGMNTAVLSPHFDDAVLSCWSVLAGGGDVTVVNAFTALPPPGGPVAWWDRATGAQDSATRMLERRDEDHAALELVGRRGVNLGLLDGQYATRGEGATSELAARLREVLAGVTVVLAPAGLGGHPDHVVVRDAALSLARDRWRVRLYADLPHAIGRGWPDWVLGGRDRLSADIAAEWAGELAAGGVIPDRLEGHVERLDADARARKLRALAAYRTQRDALDPMAFAPLDDPRTLAFEVTWGVPASALRALHQAVGDPGVADADAGGEALHERG